MARRQATDVLAKTVPLIVERGSFGERRQADLSQVQTDADKRMLALTKRLVEMEETSAIRNRDAAFRQYLLSVATPFRPGMYLVPLALVEAVEAEARVWEAERALLADAAKRAYPAAIEAMASPLGPMFNRADYPTPDEFRSKFAVDWRFVNFGVPDVLREIKAEVFAREREKVARMSAEAKTLIEQHAAASLLRITERLAALLQPTANGRRKGLKDGALDRLFGFLDTSPLRDVTDYRELQAVVRQLRQASQGLSVERLKDDEVRVQTAAALAAATAALTPLVTDVGRAIHLPDEEVV